MKKKISLFLAAAMMLTLFAGCTPSAETTPTPTPGANPTHAVMTPYEQEYVNQGKYLDLSDWNEIWDRLIPSMRENCTDVNSGKQYRICTNMTMAGFWYNKEIFDELGLKPANTWEEFVANLEALNGNLCRRALGTSR